MRWREGRRGRRIEPVMVGGFAIVMIPDLHQLTPEIRALATRVCEGLHEARSLFEADGPQRGHVPGLASTRRQI